MTYISATLRRYIEERASYGCEYCLPLTPAQKRANKSKAQKRIFVEHLIRKNKDISSGSRKIPLKTEKLRASNFGSMWIKKMKDRCDSYVLIKVPTS